jgi:hypothetical protein
MRSEMNECVCCSREPWNLERPHLQIFAEIGTSAFVKGFGGQPALWYVRVDGLASESLHGIELRWIAVCLVSLRCAMGI